MLSESLPRITVSGALSKQGRSVVYALLKSQRYQVRALTRHVQSDLALELAALGAEIKAMPDEGAHPSELIEAFKGSFGAFLMTPGYAPQARDMPTPEFAVGKKLADAALAAGVEHIVFSSLENVDEITAGKIWAPHFTDKGKVEAYIRSLPISSSFIQLAFFFTNMLEYYPPRLVGNELIFPIYLPEDFAAPFVDPLTATGPAVLEMFDNYQAYAGRTLPVIGQSLTPRQIIEVFNRVTGRNAVYRSAFSEDALRHYFPAFAENAVLAEEVAGMAEYAVNYGYFTPERDRQWSRTIHPHTLTWEAFLRQSGWQGEGLAFNPG